MIKLIYVKIKNNIVEKFYIVITILVFKNE